MQWKRVEKEKKEGGFEKKKKKTVTRQDRAVSGSTRGERAREPHPQMLQISPSS